MWVQSACALPRARDGARGSWDLGFAPTGAKRRHSNPSPLLSARRGEAEIEKGPVDLFPAEPTEGDFRSPRPNPHVRSTCGCRAPALCLNEKRISFRISFFVQPQSARRDSNPRPRPWQGRAPPTEPLAHIHKCCSQQRRCYYIFIAMSSIFSSPRHKPAGTAFY